MEGVAVDVVVVGAVTVGPLVGGVVAVLATPWVGARLGSIYAGRLIVVAVVVVRSRSVDRGAIRRLGARSVVRRLRVGWAPSPPLPAMALLA